MKPDLTKHRQLVEWWLKAIRLEGDRISPSDLDWAIRMEDSYQKKGYLSDKEMGILESIYRRYS